MARTRDVVFRVLLFAGLLAAAGAAAFRLLVWPRELPDRALSLVVLAGCALVAGGATGLAVHGTTGTRFGLVEWIIVGVAVCGAVLSLRWPLVAAVVALSLVPLPALAGHALDANQPWWSAPADAVHVAAASVWLGGLVAFGLAVPVAARVLGPMARTRLYAAAATRFSRLALAAVLALGATGLLRAFGELTAVSQAWSTSYGRTLLVKTGLLGGLTMLGALNRYRLVPRLRTASVSNPAGLRAFARLRRSVGVELALLACVVGAVALLTELPPGRNARAVAAPARVAAAPRAPKLPPAGGVVLARQDRDLALALSVRGRTATATIVGPDGDGADGLTVDLSGVAAGPCGAGCYTASLPRRPRAVAVRVGGRPPVRFSVPGRAPDATALVDRAAGVFRSLRSVVIDEQLASSPTIRIRTSFEIVAPDRLRYRIEGGGEAVVIGGRRWDRGRAGPWQPSAQSPLHLPAAPWARVRDARLLGRDRRAWIVSFLDPTVPAWFRVRLDRRTLRTLDVRMIAGAHFMHDRYGSFDAPLRIRPPR